MARKKNQEGCEMDMTPMIDVVFQLIIFFVVTMKMVEEVNPDIILEDGRHGEVLTADNVPTQTITIEVGRFGRISINNATCNLEQLNNIIRGRYNRMGPFPVMIRGDYRTRHEQIKQVMDICGNNGIGRVGFIAVAERKSGEAKRPSP